MAQSDGTERYNCRHVCNPDHAIGGSQVFQSCSRDFGTKQMPTDSQIRKCSSLTFPPSLDCSMQLTGGAAWGSPTSRNIFRIERLTMTTATSATKLRENKHMVPDPRPVVQKCSDTTDQQGLWLAHGYDVGGHTRPIGTGRVLTAKGPPPLRDSNGSRYEHEMNKLATPITIKCAHALL